MRQQTEGRPLTVAGLQYRLAWRAAGVGDLVALGLVAWLLWGWCHG